MIAGRCVAAVMDKVDVGSTLWIYVKAVATSARRCLLAKVPGTRRDGVIVDTILTGMVWFFCQKSYDPDTKMPTRLRGLPPWLNFLDEPQALTDDARSAGEGDGGTLCAMQAVPYLTHKNMPRHADGTLLPILHIADIAG